MHVQLAIDSHADHLTQFVSVCSCNIGEGGIALAEAVHGSAPDIAGKVKILNDCELFFWSRVFLLFLGCSSWVTLSLYFLQLC